MSFLNSVLSSLNDGKTALSVPQVKPAKPVNTADSVASTASKRKAEDDLRASSTKMIKTESSKPYDHNGRITSKSLLDTKPPVLPKPASQNGGIHKRPVLAAPAPTKIPPKKGSFAEILARASQNQCPPAVGTITHKPKEKLSAKKELALQKEMAVKKKRPSLDKASHSTQRSKPGTPAVARPHDTPRTGGKDLKSTGYQGTSKPKVQPTYQGTVKPKAQNVYRGTMKPGSLPQLKKGYNSDPEPPREKPVAAPRKRGYYSDEEEEGGSEDGYDYASEDFSDMDAGFDDVEEENAEAARIAKKEDAYEQMMLDELKRQKEERKKRALAGKAKERSMRR